MKSNINYNVQGGNVSTKIGTSKQDKFHDQFVGRYPVNKTLRFSLIPQGKTQENINRDGFVAADEQRDADYKTLKKLIDNYHRDFIKRSLLEVKKVIDWSNLIDALQAYQQANADGRERAESNLEDVQDAYRKEIVATFKKQDDFDGLFKKDLIVKIMPKFLNKEDEQELIEKFKNFTSYFTGFHENRKNIYSDEAKATAIANRIVNENFPRFLANCKNWEILKTMYPGFDRKVQESLEALNPDIDVAQFFEPKNYSLALTQEDIEIYNTILGGGFNSENKKILGLNNIANECWQQAKKQSGKDNKEIGTSAEREPSKRIVLQQLFRQILSEHTSIWGHLFDQYTNDGDVKDAVERLVVNLLQAKEQDASCLNQSIDLIESIDQYNPAEIKLSTKRFYLFSNICFGNGFALNEAINKCADNNLFPIKGSKKAEKEKWRNKKEWSLQELAYVVKSASLFLEDPKPQSLDLSNQEVWDILNISALTEHLKRIKANIEGCVSAAEKAITTLNPLERKLLQQEKKIYALKEFLDALLDFKNVFQAFHLSENDARNSEFYSFYDELIGAWLIVPIVYDRVRNYVTQKPYSKEKFKLTFNNPTFLEGWDVNKQDENYGTILLREGKYYLAILNPNASNKLKLSKIEGVAGEDASTEIYQKVDYKLFPDATKMIPKCSIARNDVMAHFEESKSDYLLSGDNFVKPLRIPYAIFDLNYLIEDGKRVAREPKKYQVEYKRNTNDELGFAQALADWIDFCLDFLESYKSTSIFDFSGCRDKTYERLDQFYEDVNRIAYSLVLRPVAKETIDGLVEEGRLFLFQIYNKDFAPGATGAKNLHTLYFEALFSEHNLQANTFKLDGNAEMFYRPASIDNPFVHKEGEYLVNKTFEVVKDGVTEKESLPDDIYKELFAFANGRLTRENLTEGAIKYLDSGSVVIKPVAHTIVKDKRFTMPQYDLHIPMTLNFGASKLLSAKNNSDVLKCLKGNPDIAIIGIDRGERNLLYYSVIDQQGRILDKGEAQGSLNVVDFVDYHEKLDTREKERTEQRRSWKSIDKIKDLKKGYLSVAVHRIIELMLEHNAIVVMEDLNTGFKRSRTRFEKQIYQNFEKQLIDKLNYCALKPGDRDQTSPGGILQGYQLANKFESFEKLGKQSGAIFYVPAWNTSHIDPTTGFARLFKAIELKYQNIEIAKDFFRRFDCICFNAQEGYFEFEFSYDNFQTVCDSPKANWTVCSHETTVPIVKYKQGTAATDEVININQSLKDLFSEYDIDYRNGINLQEIILEVDEVNFFKRLLFLFEVLTRIRYYTTSGAVDIVDCIVSPVKNENGYFFDSRDCSNDLPKDGDANGAYNIALKGLQMIQEQIEKSSKDYLRIAYPKKPNEQWLRFVQERAWKNR